MVELNKNAQQLAETRYYQNRESSWAEIADRVAGYISQNNTEYYSQYKNVILNQEFIPSSPTLFNAGANSGQLSSCFIIKVEDNIESIMQGVAECAKIFQMSGGAGFNISHLRPQGDAVKTAGGKSSGPVSFMNIYDVLVDEVTQQNLRKGALKVDMYVSHPDIFLFINSKKDTSKLNNMNISVLCSDDFMQAVEDDSDWDLVFDQKVYKTVKARDLWDEIVSNAHQTGEPGINFIDNMEKDNMNPHIDQIESTNPCSEYVDIPYSSCNLGSINLEKMVFKKGDNYKFNWEKFRKVIRVGITFLADVIDKNNFPLKKIEEVTRKIRPVGLGVMGFSNMLFKLGIPYNSEEAVQFADKLFGFMYDSALDRNQELAEERGVYPAWEGSEWDKIGYKVNLSSMLSIAPTGSISILAGTTQGIEPEFALIYDRRTDEGDILYFTNSVFEEALKDRGLYNKRIMRKIADNKGSCQGIDDIPHDIQEVFVTARDISAEYHVKVLSAISEHVDLSISKTVNMDADCTVDDVKEVYQSAWRSGIKGLTVYREGSRDSILKAGGEKSKEVSVPKERPQRIEGVTEVYETGCGKVYITINKDEAGKIFETFITTGSNGGCVSMTQGLGRMTSMALRAGIPVKEIIDQLKSADPCNSFSYHRGAGKKLYGRSCPSIIARVLEKELNGDDLVSIKVDNNNKKDCPECGAELAYVEGCSTCLQCGFSNCSDK